MNAHEYGVSANHSSNEKKSKLVPWSREQAQAFGLRPLIAKHRLNELDLFSDEALLNLIENYPRELVQAFTMGADPLSWRDWQPVDTAGVSAKEIFTAILRGRLWFKMLQVHLVDQRYGALIDQLYAELTDQCPNFRPVRKSGTLLVSSPTAMVYYHADAEPNLLWHIRGSKRVWVYPAGDRQLVSQELMEDICAHVVDEEAPYKPDFDTKAMTFDLGPGNVISWPLNAPHRVSNLEGVNVSLSTLHETKEADQRKLVYCANRLFRCTYAIPFRSTKETGVVPWFKRLAFRGFRRAGLVKTPPRRRYITNLRVDPDAPDGFSPVAGGPVLTEFSRKYY